MWLPSYIEHLQIYFKQYLKYIKDPSIFQLTHNPLEDLKMQNSRCTSEGC